MDADSVRQKITNKLTRAILEGVLAARVVADPNDHAERIKANEAHMEAMEDEIAQVVGPFAQKLYDLIPEDHPLRQFVSQGFAPEHQISLLVQIFGIIPAAFQYLKDLGQIVSQPALNEAWSEYPSIPLSPADLADMVERNIIEQADGEAAAAQSGLGKEQFDLLVLNTGEPIGIDQALTLWLRGAMNDDFLEKTVYYSRVRNEFLPYIKALAHHQMSPADAIEIALKRVDTQDNARKYFAEGGGLPDQFDVLLAAAGSPIGPEAAANLLAHGVIDKATFDSVVAHSRINPMFTQLVADTHLKWLSVYQIGEALKAGTVTPQVAAEWLVQDGYNADQAAAFTGGSATGKTVKPKSETESLILEEYQAMLMSEAEATSMLAQLGYSQGEITLLLELATAKQILAQRNQAVGKVRTLFITKKITKGQASTDLDALGIATQARDAFIASWTVEQTTNIKQFSEAQIGSFLKKGLITATEAVSRWEAMGYVTADAQLLAQSYGLVYDPSTGTYNVAGATGAMTDATASSVPPSS